MVTGFSTARHNRCLDFIGNTIGLVTAGAIKNYSHRGSWRRISEKYFRFAFGVVSDEAVGRTKNVRRASIVPFKFHNACGGIVAFKLKDVANARSPPSIDRLIGITSNR